MSEQDVSKCDFEGEKLLLRLDFSGPAELSSIESVIHWVMNAAKEIGCAAGKEFEVAMALREALANAVIHGCKGDPTKKIQFWVGCDHERGMLIVVRDPGDGFDPASIPSPVLGERVYSEHGRGIFLINQLMDEVRFERGGTEIRMRKR